MEVLSYRYLQTLMCRLSIKQRSVFMVFIIKTTWSKVVCFKVYKIIALYRGIPRTWQSCPQDSHLEQFNRVVPKAGSCMAALCFICFGLFHSYYVSSVTLLFWVLLSVFEGGLWSYLSQASVFRAARFAPSVSHHCFWLSPLTGNERFILSGLNYIVPS